MDDAAGTAGRPTTDESPILQPTDVNPEEIPSSEQDRYTDTKTRRKKKHNERAPAERDNRSSIQDIVGFLLHLAIVIAAVWAIFTFVFGVSIARGETMYPRIRDGDVLFSYRMQRDIRTGDVLAVKKDGREFIGRVVAVGGETVDITPEGQLLVNGNAASEEIFYATYLISGGQVTYPHEVPQDSFFLLSDFRTNGYDSRNYGDVSRKEIKGKVITLMRRRGI